MLEKNNMKNTIQIIFFVCSFFLFGCSGKDKEIIPLEYVKYVEDEDNALKISKEIGDVVYTLQYKPVDYLIALEQKKNIIDINEYTKRKVELDGMEYFTLELKSKENNIEVMNIGALDKNEYNERIQYASYDLQNDIYLLIGKDTIPCGLYHFEQKYGLGNSVKILVGFEKLKTPSKNLTVVLEDKILNGGVIKFLLLKENIDLLPKMKIIK